MDPEKGLVFVHHVKQARAICGFPSAYNMAIASSSGDAFLSCKMLAEFQHLFLSLKGVFPISCYIDTVIQSTE